MTPEYAIKTIGKFVPDEGPIDAEIVVIGEFPWLQEANQGRPFVGAGGKLQDRWMRDLGIDRGRVRFMYLFPFQPKRRDLGSVDIAELISRIEMLHTRIAGLKNPKVIVAIGDYVTFALTGKGKVSAVVRNAFALEGISATDAEKKAGITKLRGSVYDYRDKLNRMIKVVPIINPSEIIITQKWEKRTISDWGRIKRISDGSLNFFPERKHIVSPSEWQVENFVRLVEGNSKDLQMALDIETWGKTLSCCGFAISPWESITIQLTGREGKVFLPYVKRLVESRVEKILCNGLYDWYWLAWWGMWIKNFLWDVQLMHHAIDPVENHSLDFLASIYVDNYRYWKDEGKDGDEVIKYSHDLEALWVYNGLDCCYTRELLDLVRGDLTKENLLEFYFKHYQQMIEPLVRTMLHGFRIHKNAQKDWAAVLRKEMAEIHGMLNEAAGEELFAVEIGTDLREPTSEEWIRLCGEVPGGIPGNKQINKEVRKQMIAEGLTYCIGGKDAGKIRFKTATTKKDFSKDKLLKFFYETLNLPRQYKFSKGKEGRSKSISLDEGSIRKLNSKFPERIKNWGNLVLAFREKKKELDYLKGCWDKDGRIRCSYKMLTEAGRLASSKNPMGSGYNLQNIKR